MLNTDQGNWYDLKDTAKITLQDIYLICGMAPPGGGRNDVSPRFLRHFNMVSMTPFNDDTMSRIFTVLMTTYMRQQGFTTDFIACGQSMVAGTLEIYKSAMQNLLPTPSKSHYVFNLRDFARVVLGICMINKNQIENKKTFYRYLLFGSVLQFIVLFVTLNLKYFKFFSHL